MDETGSSCGEGVGKAGAEVGMVGGYLGGFRARLLQELDWPATGGPLAAAIMPREAGAWCPRQVAGDALGRHRVFQEGSAEAHTGSGCRAWVLIRALGAGPDGHLSAHQLPAQHTLQQRRATFSIRGSQAPKGGKEMCKSCL